MSQVISMAGRQQDSERKWTVLNVGAKTAVGLRSGAAKHGIRQMPDFMNAVILAGVMLSKSTKPNEEPIEFVDVFNEEVDDIFRIIQEGHFSDEVKGVGTHELGEAIEMDLDQIIAGALSANGVIDEIGDEYDMSTREKMVVATLLLVMGTVGGTQEEYVDIALDMVKDAVADKASAWGAVIPQDSDWTDEV